MRACPASNDPVSSLYEPLVAHLAEKNIITKRSTLTILPWRTNTPDDIGLIY